MCTNQSEKYISLASANPLLSSQWHPTRNGDLTPSDVSYGSHNKVWWICDLQHEWTATIKARSHGANCPYCSNHKVLSGYNDLATTHPNLVVQWDFDKNVIKPSEITAGSSKKVFWICDKKHSWQTAVKLRTSRKSSCPFCTGKSLLAGFNDLQTIDPLLAEEWHPSKNRISPNEILAGSHTKVWWQCKNKHEWFISPNHRRSKSRGCPYCCHNPKVLPGSNDLMTVRPDLVKEWDYERNGDLTPGNFTANSSKSVYWKCSKGHSWKTTICHRADGSGCPVCASANQTSFPEQAVFYYVKKYYPDALSGFTDVFRNHGMELDVYVPSMHIGIEYDGRFHNHTPNRERDKKKYQKCCDCGIKLIRLKEDKSDFDHLLCNKIIYVGKELSDSILALREFLPLMGDVDVHRDEAAIKSTYINTKAENSFMALHPELVSEWHSEKNGQLTPDLFSPNSSQRIHWLCKNGHEWVATIYSRSSGHQCPYCTNRLVMPGFNDLAAKRPDLLEEWDFANNPSLDPSHLLPGSGKKANWICKDGHRWCAEISSRNKGHGCPVCAVKNRGPRNQKWNDPAYPARVL